MLNLIVFCMSDGILSMLGAVYCNAPDFLYMKGSLTMGMNEVYLWHISHLFWLIINYSSLRLMDCRIECRSDSCIKSLLVFCCAKFCRTPVWLKWFADGASSLVLDGATHSLGTLVLYLGNTGNIFEYFSHGNMEPTSWIFRWYDQKCKYFSKLFSKKF